MYKTDIMGIPSTKLTCLSVIDYDPLLWHKRLRYASLKQLNKLASKDLVIRLPKTKFKDDKICSACVRGKQVRTSFNQRTWLVLPGVLN